MMDPASLLDDFCTEAFEKIDVLDAQLLALERTPTDPQALRLMFLSAHTIKGNAAMVGLTSIHELSHAMEDVLAWLRDERQPLDPDTANVLFQSIDLLRRLVAGAGLAGTDPAAEVRAAAIQLRSRTTASPAPAVAPPPSEAALKAPASAPTSPSPLASSAPPLAPVARPRALLIQDSPTVRMLERIVLVDAGFDVDALADGEEALAHARETPYDLVVTGIELRGVNGLELVAALRAQPHFADVPVIITSSAENPEHRQRARALGVRHYVPKGSLSEQRLGEAARAAFARLEG